MSDAPSSPTPPTHEVDRRALARDRLDRDAVIAALVGVLLIHLLAVWLSPRQAPMPEEVKMPQSQQVRLELVPAPPEVEDDPQYVRANPDAPVEVPEDTQNFSNRDQVSAQEESAPLSEDNTPLVQGDREQSNRIVQGSPYEPPPQPSAASAQAAADQQALPEQQPAPDLVEEQTPPDVREALPETEEGIASLEDPRDNVESPEDPSDAEQVNPQEVQSPLDGRGDALTFRPAQQPAYQPTPTPREPRPDRPRVPDNSFGPVQKSFTGASRVGQLSIASRFTEFGAYWNRAQEAIERQWNNLVRNSQRSIQFNGNEVTIEFVISRDGSVSNVRVVASSVGRLPEALALDAISSPAPFPEWTPEMIAQMGTSYSTRITFIY